MKKSLPREILEILLFGLPILFFIKVYAWRNFTIPTTSMENTILAGDHVIANSFLYGGPGDPLQILLPQREPRRGDVVAFRFPGDHQQVWMKRIVGLPGETFTYKSDQNLVNEVPILEPYTYYKLPSDMRTPDRDPNNLNRPLGYDQLKPGLAAADPTLVGIQAESNLASMKKETRKKLKIYEKLNPTIYRRLLARLDAAPADRIPTDFYVIMGDNRNRSIDSRRWGLVPREMLLGKAYLVWWSYGAPQNTHQLKGKDKLMSYLLIPVRIWTHTRFPETFRLIR